jgi:hypothetical protein
VNRSVCRSLRLLVSSAALAAFCGAPVAEAVVGAPATPVSYAGVARRSPGPTPGMGPNAPGVAPDRDPGLGKGAPGPGVAPGVGVTPGMGPNAPGVLPDRDPGLGKGAPGGPGVANAGGPVNRVGIR